MTELETRLLQLLQQQQSDSVALVNGLSAQLGRLQTALNEQLADNAALRQEIEQSEARTVQALDGLTQQFNELSRELERLAGQSRA